MRSPGWGVALLALAVLAFWRSATAEETFKISVPQRGLWDTAVSEMGRRSGIMQKYGLDLEILYTSGGAESQQAVISGSMQLSCGGGIEGAVGAYSKGAPLRIIGSEMIGSPDTYWYVRADSPIRSLKEASGKTISYSVTGSSSHAAVLSLIDQYRVDAKPVATGSHPTTLTMTMSGQIDIGRGAAPFGLELVEEGKIRVIARGSEIKARSDQTVRDCVANLQTLQG
jgi:NitT/TauT family transport system substrate-binding protein